MKQTKILLAALCGTALLFSSCEKDDPKPSEDQDQTSVIKDPSDTTNTGVDTTSTGGLTKKVETQKQDIEDAGIQLISEIDDLQESKSMKAMEALASLGSEESNSIAVTFTQVASNPTSLKSTSQSIVDKFNEEKGIFTWNSTTNEWDEAPSSEGIFYKFPSVEGGTVNDAEIGITNFSTEFINLAEEEAEVPTSLNAYLKVGDEEVLSYEMTGKYGSDGLPEDVSTSLEIDSEFKLTATLQASASSISESFSFTRNGSNLIAFGTSATGEFTEAKVEEVDSIMNSVGGEEMPNFSVLGDLLSSFEFYYQIIDIKLNTAINTKALANEDIKGIVENEDEDAALKAVNDNVQITLAYANGDLIAETEFILEEVVDDYNGEIYNEPNVIFIFSDGSRVAAETYFEESLTNFENELEAFVQELEETYEL